MSPGRESQSPSGDAGLSESPVEKFLRLAESPSFLRLAESGDHAAGGFVTLNVGGITAADASTYTSPIEPHDEDSATGG
jgi:hypothetical protein